MTEASAAAQELRDINRSALCGDTWINGAGSEDEAKARIEEVRSKLNSEVPYAGKSVQIFGIHKFNRPVEDVFDPNVAQLSLVRGSIRGPSEGFTVADLQSQEFEVLADGDQDDAELVEEIREAAIGRYAVSHMVYLTDMRTWNFDRSNRTLTQYSAVTPVVASHLFLNTPPSMLETPERLAEIERLSALIEPRLMNFYRSIEDSVVRRVDKMEGLVAEAENFASLLTQLSEPDRNIIIDRLSSQVFRPDVIDQYTVTGGLPTSILERDAGNNHVSRPVKYPPGPPLNIHLVGLSHGPGYKERPDGRIRLTNDTKLFARVVIEHPQEGTEVVAVPVEAFREVDLQLKMA